MNRQQRRREKRQKQEQDNVYTLNKENIEAIKREARQEAFEQFKNAQKEMFDKYVKEKIKTNVKCILGAFLFVLMEKVDTDNIGDTIKHLIGYYNNLNENEMETAVKAVEDKAGCKIDVLSDGKIVLDDSNG